MMMIMNRAYPVAKVNEQWQARESARKSAKAMEQSLEVMAINYGMEVILLSDNTNVSITTWLDIDNIECSKDVATDCVAGPDTNGKWWRCELVEFDSATTH